MAIIPVRISPRGIEVPERTVVKLGETVTWAIAGDLPGLAELQIYFDDSAVAPSPLSQRWSGGGGAQAVARIQFRASRVGDHKYGVRALDRQGRTLDDEDPWLIVRP